MARTRGHAFAGFGTLAVLDVLDTGPTTRRAGAHRDHPRALGQGGEGRGRSCSIARWCSTCDSPVETLTNRSLDRRTRCPRIDAEGVGVGVMAEKASDRLDGVLEASHAITAKPSQGPALVVPKAPKVEPETRTGPGRGTGAGVLLDVEGEGYSTSTRSRQATTVPGRPHPSQTSTSTASVSTGSTSSAHSVVARHVEHRSVSASTVEHAWQGPE